MTKTIVLAMVATLMAVACGGDDDQDQGTSPPGEQTPTSLSTAFKNTCATCHGEEGRGQGTYPEIPGNKTESEFIAIARSGRGLMPANDESQISDADLKSDYLWLTTQRQ